MSDINLAALTAHPSAGAFTVAADAGAQWAAVHAVTDVADLWETVLENPARVLVVVLAGGPGSDWERDALVRRVADAGYRGLALPAGRTDTHTGDLARRLGVTLLRVEEPVEFLRACWQLCQAGDSLTLQHVRKSVQATQYRAAHLSDLLRHLSAGLGHSLAVVRADEVVAQVGDPVPPAVVARRPERWLSARCEGDVGAVSLPLQGARHGWRLIVHGRGWSEGQLHAVATAAEVALPAVAARILLDDAENVGDAARASTLLTAVIDADGEVDPALEERLVAQKWRLAGPLRAVHVVARERTDPVGMLRLVLGEVGAAQAVNGALHGDGVTCWVQAPPGEDPVPLLRDAHRRIRSQMRCSTGVGSVGEGPAGLVASIHQACDAARLAADRASAEWFMALDGTSPAQLLRAWTQPDTFVDTARQALAELTADELLTLAAYLDQESSVAGTAAALGVHRNTILPRLRRIEERLGASLTDADTRLALHLATRVITTGEG